MNEYKPCPKCGTEGAKRITFTWWGGFLGPKLLNHAKCRSCGSQFNGKTGASNTSGIFIYTVVVAGFIGMLLIVGVLTFVIFSGLE